MKRFANCPHCLSNKPLWKKYFGKPMDSITRKSETSDFIVKIEIDICQTCNAVYATMWETIRIEEIKEKEKELNGK